MAGPIKDEWQSEDGSVRLILGDCLDVLPLLDNASIDAVVTDPPYSSGGQFRSDRVQRAISKYVRSESIAAGHYRDFTGDNRDQRSFFAWCSLWLCAAMHATSRGGVLCCFSDWRQVPVMTDAVQAAGWTWRNLCTWWKPGCRMQRGRFSSSAEFLIYGTAGPHDSDGEKSPQNVLQLATLQTNEKEHIAEKPVEVLEWAVSVSRHGAAVLDPFCGVSSTGVAALRTGRSFVGIEVERTYFDLSVARMQAELERFPLFESKTRNLELF